MKDLLEDVHQSSSWVHQSIEDEFWRDQIWNFYVEPFMALGFAVAAKESCSSISLFPESSANIFKVKEM